MLERIRLFHWDKFFSDKKHDQSIINKRKLLQENEGILNQIKTYINNYEKTIRDAARAGKDVSFLLEDIAKEEEKKSSWLPFVLGGLAFCGLGLVAPSSFVSHFTVFILACFVGYMVIWNVTPALHTPLMSVTNAISSIIIIGALLQISAPDPWVIWLSGFAVLITSINIFCGFAVTQRMLDMFKK